MKKILLLLSVVFVSPIITAQEFLNASSFGGYYIDNQYRTAQDSKDNLYTVGFYSSGFDFGTTTIGFTGGNADGYLTKYNSNGEPVWAKDFGGWADDVTLAVTIDKDDNILITGYFQGGDREDAFDADPGEGVFLLKQPSAILSRDTFIIKLTNDGDFIWAKQISNTEGLANEDTFTITSDNEGNVYVGGRFVYADFDPSPDVDLTMYSSTEGAKFDGYLLKLDTNGDFVWVKTIPATGHNCISGISFDSNENIILTGYYEGTVDLDPSETGTASYTSNGGRDVFLTKLTKDGNYVWGKSFGGNDIDDPKSLFVSHTDDIFITGFFTSATDFNPGEGTDIITPDGIYAGFMSKYNASGEYQFSYTIGSNYTSGSIEDMNDVKVNPHNNNIYIAGNFNGSVDFDNGEGVSQGNSFYFTDNYLLELDSNGNYLSHYIFGGNGPDAGGLINFNNNNEVLLSGTFTSSTIDLNPFEGKDEATNNGGGFMDMYTTRFSLATLSVKDNVLSVNTSIYPNPARNILNVTTSNASVISTYKIYSVSGQLIKTGAFGNGNIDVSQLKPGMYLASFSNGNASFSKKFVKL
ncbi:T9SS type A sorting domain-containing protein [Formosa algae]|uniref:Secretion system C-terminal sorting domain-containing protein n=1 Tax=Formosa algae TaxID=225843 RepID=A0A9X0YKV9_9FLAO|nr:T9SS type A sorting domain-containing protein [Formosa algae]MBP1840461.1 hypothetical protein [Formosa algae]MDQ0336953.1 hypothetical protein [Formosa algae]OEI80838.1 hypothetical protein AST99_07250 [Formosa algae]PNW28171.1 hypothetical protein BKP44_09875 [Formosa algae]